MSKGGKRTGAGAKAIDGATNVKRTTICLEDEDRAKLQRLGGSPWVRRVIRAAPLPECVRKKTQE